MTIKVEQIKKLIEDYWGYERECTKGEYDPVAFGRAALYRTVIMDLERLLPRKSMADILPKEWPDYVGTWVEHDGVNKVIFKLDQMSEFTIGVFDPKSGGAGFVWPENAFPTEYSAAWDSEGNPT